SQERQFSNHSAVSRNPLRIGHTIPFRPGAVNRARTSLNPAAKFGNMMTERNFRLRARPRARPRQSAGLLVKSDVDDAVERLA
ncbi:MAG: hypothetical protein ACREDN_11505, partial [Aestuariivirga sp.]